MCQPFRENSNLREVARVVAFTTRHNETRGEPRRGERTLIMGRKLCSHGREKSKCAVCTPCPHGKRKSLCAECVGCPRGKLKHRCAECTPCPHGKLKHICTMCTGYPHGKRKYRCAECSRNSSER